MTQRTFFSPPIPATPPKVLVSRCLTGERCRHDGAARPAAALELLPRHWLLLDLCPESDLGMGVPRPPIGLLTEGGRLRLVERNGGRDWTEEMESWCALLARVLVADGVAGAVLKARSPSCGLGDADLFSSRALMAWPGPPEAALRRDADGLLTLALRAHDGGLPLIGDESLAGEAARARFIEAVERRHRAAAPTQPWF
ncbi:MAG: DUF523 domain-containing protein [bacterium]|jgi:uncharacterized protein YbbK (DUF523 family)|nr:DUF523 domain-containing protein [bacterium]